MKKALFFTICAILSASSSDTNSAKNSANDARISLVKSLYIKDTYFGDHKNVLSASFKSALMQDEASAGEGEVGCLDYDPIIGGQDVCDDAKYDFELGQRDTVVVTQTCPYGTQTIIYKLVRSGDDYKIDDIYNQNPSDSRAFSVKNQILNCLNQSKEHQ
ncbi:hypothetical protein [uncultured Campylobacter sp.]|uniref:hypothetical protein n=1 Tax=uncultured Campylobacter sp. TaxID=218934 RepID=UPI00260CD7ED|nr:hypothetical protein [uncultured Campylobacter sp.]